MDLIERLRERAEFEDKRVLDEANAMGFVPEVYTGSQTGALLLEAAAALEAAREDAAEAKQNGYELGLLAAAREDAERWRQAFVDERASRYRADGMKVEQARIHAETDAEVAAIDQARGKGEP